jgi:Asp-tRNA(Asn)/Glu-tRNA(Gln) amidotransferase A subunit family amidase
VRVGLSIDLGIWAVDPDVEAAVRAAADALADAGAVVTEVDLGFRGDEEKFWNKLWSVFMAAYYGHLVEEFGHRMAPEVLGLIERGNAMSAVEYKQVEFIRTRMWDQLRPILATNEVLLCPTMATGPVDASISGTRVPGHMEEGRYHSPDMTAIWNMVSPCPALTVPCGLDGDGMPVGAQLIGQRWRSDRVLDVGGALERALPPVGRPPI